MSDVVVVNRLSDDINDIEQKWLHGTCLEMTHDNLSSSFFEITLRVLKYNELKKS